MEVFTKVFETEKTQVAVLMDGGENPKLHQHVNIGGIFADVCLDFPDSETGWKQMESAFEKYGQEQADELVSKVSQLLKGKS